jgi:hypothetical protein
LLLLCAFAFVFFLFFYFPPSHPGFRSYRPCGRSSSAILLATVPPVISTSSAEVTNTIMLAKMDGKREGGFLKGFSFSLKS